MPPNRHTRAYQRWRVGQAATVEAAQGVYEGCLEDLSFGGAFVSGCGALSVGTGVRLSFRLPTQMLVHAAGTVVRKSDGTGAEQRRGVGIQFQPLDAITKNILNDFFETQQPAGGAIAHVHLEEKYRIELSDKGAIFLRLRGYLDQGECAAIARLLHDVADDLNERTIQLVIDASEYVCGAPDSVAVFRRTLVELARQTAILGVLVGPKSLGMTQLRRATREAGVADVFTGFGQMTEALDFLGSI